MAKKLVGPRIRNQGLVRVRVADLEEAPWNFRTHPQAQQEALSGVVDELGWHGYPEVYKTPEGKLRLTDGHLRKSFLLGKYGPDAEIEVSLTDFTEEEARKATLTIDPLAALAESSKERLDELLASVEVDSAPMIKMLEGLASEAGCDWHKQAEIVEDDIPEPPAVPITKPGDLWALGEHRLLCGDSTKAEDVSRLMGGENADICFTSPPYNVGSNELGGNTNMVGSKYDGFDDDRTDEEYLAFLIAFTTTALDACKSVVCNIQILAGNKRTVLRWMAHFADRFVDLAIWDKGAAPPQMTGNVLNNQCELIVVLSQESSPTRAIPFGAFHGTLSTIYEGPPQRDKAVAKLHAATMPVHLPAFVIATMCEKATSVYEPFCGSGTTMVVCEQLGRKCYGMELSPLYCDVTVARWEKATGKKAVLESAGA